MVVAILRARIQFSIKHKATVDHYQTNSYLKVSEAATRRSGANEESCTKPMKEEMRKINMARANTKNWDTFKVFWCVEATAFVMSP